MTGELHDLLVRTDARGNPGEWKAFCPVHEDRTGNRSLDIDVKAKESDHIGDTAYPRLYMWCRSRMCGANALDMAAVLGLDWSRLEADALAADLPAQPKRPWKLPSSTQVEQWAQARRDDPEATRWLTEERLLSVDFLDRFRVG